MISLGIDLLLIFFFFSTVGHSGWAGSGSGQVRGWMRYERTDGMQRRLGVCMIPGEHCIWMMVRVESRRDMIRMSFPMKTMLSMMARHAMGPLMVAGVGKGHDGCIDVGWTTIT